MAIGIVDKQVGRPALTNALMLKQAHHRLLTRGRAPAKPTFRNFFAAATTEEGSGPTFHPLSGIHFCGKGLVFTIKEVYLWKSSADKKCSSGSYISAIYFLGKTAIKVPLPYFPHMSGL